MTTHTMLGFENNVSLGLYFDGFMGGLELLTTPAALSTFFSALTSTVFNGFSFDGSVLFGVEIIFVSLLPSSALTVGAFTGTGACNIALVLMAGTTATDSFRGSNCTYF